MGWAAMKGPLYYAAQVMLQAFQARSGAQENRLLGAPKAQRIMDSDRLSVAEHDL